VPRAHLRPIPSRPEAAFGPECSGAHLLIAALSWILPFSLMASRVGTTSPRFHCMDPKGFRLASHRSLFHSFTDNSQLIGHCHIYIYICVYVAVSD